MMGTRIVLLAALILPLAPAQTLSLHPKNPHYFLFHGKAVPLITSGEHYGAVLNADFDYHPYLATLQKDGLNYTRIFGGSYVEVPSKSFGILRNTLAPNPGRFVAPWKRSGTPGYAGGGNKFNLEQWNAEYFERLHGFLAEASKRGIVVELSLFTSHYDEKQWKISPLNAANNVNATSAIDWKKLHTLENGNILGWQERYTRKLVREANQFDNVFFEIQNEPWSDRPVKADAVDPKLQETEREKRQKPVDIADTLSLAWQTRVVNWITTEEQSLAKKHLIAENYCNFGAKVQSLVPGVSIVNFHYAYPYSVTLNYGLGKALAYDETGFRGREDSVYRREAWNFMLSGGSTFDNLDYSFSTGHEGGTDTGANGPGGGTAALRRQLHILGEFLNSLPLVDLHPDRNVVKHAAGMHARVLTNGRDVYAIYFDGSGPAEVTFTLPAGEFSGEWINPATGSVEKKDRFTHTGGDKALATPAFQNGMALRLKRKAA